jgi:hypothetical protein
LPVGSSIFSSAEALVIRDEAKKVSTSAVHALIVAAGE